MTQKFFLQWPLRGSFTKLEEMEYYLRIGASYTSKNVSEEQLLDYIQFIINAIRFVEEEIKHYHDIYCTDESIIKAICDQPELMLNHLNAEFQMKDDELFAVYKDDVAEVVARTIPDISPKVMEYLKIDNRHDLERKSEILCTLYKKLEPHESTLNGTEFKSLCSDTTAIIQRVARHALDKKDKLDAKFLEMTDQEKEMWADRAFQMLLGCLSVIPYINSKNEIKKLKS